ncbi:ABC-2 family transporter protein [Jeotgalicoccus saudimassiliensis]|uniref:ABC-2 family transporter protein n=1 Tax=Jeotgalicoccus saudimassiliensis TaxID=1461582 RepID=A0A078M6Z7_9STAP|nr:hypothetical protein [Jeotgalicoccus saudimassiliensis]CEA02035.1 ABC-2 family transporter protein [Jeotgalicoccus saudimassiliensis]
MTDMIYARWLLIKRRLPKILIWLTLPLFLTLAASAVFNNTSDDFRVPVAVIVHEQSAEADYFAEGLAGSEFMDVEVFDDTESQAVLRELEQYQLDSVFILPEDYEEKVRDVKRRNLIETYFTDRSIYYEPAKELAASVIQERMGAYGTVDFVMNMQEEMLAENEVSGEEIAAERERIETGTNLVQQVFYFHGERTDTEEQTGLNPWAVWAYITLIITIFTFDFVTRETVGGAGVRFTFMKYSYKSFMILTFVLMTGLMLVIDGITWMIISDKLSADISLLSLVMYRIVVNSIAFLLASAVSTPVKLYQLAIAVAMTVLVLHVAMPVIISVTGIHVISALHPVRIFTENNLNIPWLIILILLMFVWMWRDSNARS